MVHITLLIHKSYGNVSITWCTMYIVWSIIWSIIMSYIYNPLYFVTLLQLLQKKKKKKKKRQTLL